MCASGRRTESGLGLSHAFFSNNTAMRLIPQPLECARARRRARARMIEGTRARASGPPCAGGCCPLQTHQFGDKSVRKSTRMRGLSPTVMQPSKPFQFEEMSTRGVLSPSPFTRAMTHGDAIPAMQMQTCMIFTQIALLH